MSNGAADGLREELRQLREELARLQHAEADRQRAEARFQFSQELNRRILEAMPGGIVQIALDGSVVAANPEAQRMLGLSYTELTNRYIGDFDSETIREDGSPCPMEDYPVTRCLRTGKPQPATTIGVHKPGGDITWAIFTAVPLTDPETEQQTGAIVTFLDITSRKQAELALRQSEDRYRTLIEHAPEAIVVHEAGRCLFVNSAAVKLWGAQSAEEVLGRNVLDFVHPDDRELVRDRIDELMIGRDSAPLVDRRLIRLDGETIYAEVAGITCMYDGRRCIQAVMRDVTERKQAQEALRSSMELFHALAKMSPVGIYRTDAAGKCTYVNERWSAISGVGHEAALGDGWGQALHPEDRQRVLNAWTSAVQEDREFRLQYRMMRPDGFETWVLGQAVAERDPAGKTIGFVGTITDISQQKQAEETLQHAKEELEERVAERTVELTRKNEELQIKQEFLQQMLNAHERDRQLMAYEIHDTFLQDVIGALLFIDSFHAKRDTATAEDWQEIDQARHLLRKSIGEARRLISGLRPPIIDEQGVVPAIEYLVNEFRSRGFEIDFAYRMPVERAEPLLEATIFRIVQEALTNLERHGKTNYGEINLIHRGDHIRLEIRDYGVGFEPGNVGAEHFGLQGIRERSRTVGGTATIQSSPNQGTRITVELPVGYRP